jgi:hypothetical protein
MIISEKIFQQGGETSLKADRSPFAPDLVKGRRILRPEAKRVEENAPAATLIIRQ